MRAATARFQVQQRLDALYTTRGGPLRSKPSNPLLSYPQTPMASSPSQVQQRLDALYTTRGGPLKPGDLDERCLDRLSQLSRDVAVTVLEVFANKK